MKTIEAQSSSCIGEDDMVRFCDDDKRVKGHGSCMDDVQGFLGRQWTFPRPQPDGKGRGAERHGFTLNRFAVTGMTVKAVHREGSPRAEAAPAAWQRPWPSRSVSPLHVYGVEGKRRKYTPGFGIDHLDPRRCSCTLQPASACVRHG